MTIKILLFIIVFLLLVIVLAVPQVRKLLSGLLGLVTAGFFVLIGLGVFLVTAIFLWNILEHALAGQFFWWIEFFVATCCVVVGVGNLSMQLVMFFRLLLILVRSEEELVAPRLDLIAIPWVLSYVIIPVSSLLASFGILTYQILNYFKYNSWRSISVIDLYFYYFEETLVKGALSEFAGQSWWYLQAEFLPLSIGILFFGILLFILYLLIMWIQITLVIKVSGKDIV
jgi:hypothetical protein